MLTSKIAVGTPLQLPKVVLCCDKLTFDIDINGVFEKLYMQATFITLCSRTRMEKQLDWTPCRKDFQSSDATTGEHQTQHRKKCPASGHAIAGIVNRFQASRSFLKSSFVAEQSSRTGVCVYQRGKAYFLQERMDRLEFLRGSGTNATVESFPYIVVVHSILRTSTRHSEAIHG